MSSQFSAPLPEEIAEQLKVGSHPEEALAVGDELQDMQNRVWCQVMQLAAVKDQEPTREPVQQESEPPAKELLVNYPLTIGRHRNRLLSRQSTSQSRR